LLVELVLASTLINMIILKLRYALMHSYCNISYSKRYVDVFVNAAMLSHIFLFPRSKYIRIMF
jgi:hypothetical protein